jgi:hypothetical protein
MIRQVKKSLWQLCLIGTLAASNSATAGLIDFEGPYRPNGPLAGDFGFNWQNMYFHYGYLFPGTGYEHGVVSGSMMAFNGDADTVYGAKPGSIYRDTPFFFESVYVTKAWANGTTRFTGYLDDVPIFTKDVYATTEAPTFAVFNWSGIDKIVISDIDVSYQTVIDDLRFSEIPEPTYGALMLTGLIAYLLARRRQH